MKYSIKAKITKRMLIKGQMISGQIFSELLNALRDAIVRVDEHEEKSKSTRDCFIVVNKNNSACAYFNTFWLLGYNFLVCTFVNLDTHLYKTTMAIRPPLFLSTGDFHLCMLF